MLSYIPQQIALALTDEVQEVKQTGVGIIQIVTRMNICQEQRQEFAFLPADKQKGPSRPSVLSGRAT